MANRRRRLLPGIAFVFELFAVLQAITQSGLVNPVIVPAPVAVPTYFFGMLGTAAVGRALVQTLLLLAAGYALGCGLAIVLGVLMGSSRRTFDLFEPITEFLRPVPKPALLPALMLFLGLGAPMKIWLVAITVFFPVLVNTVQGAQSVDRTMIDMARTFGHGRLTLLVKIVLPATLPYIMAGMRISLAIGIVMVVLAEMLTVNGGVGGEIVDMQRQFFVKQTYAWVLLLALLGLALNAVFVAIERRVLFWQLSQTEVV